MNTNFILGILLGATLAGLAVQVAYLAIAFDVGQRVRAWWARAVKR